MEIFRFGSFELDVEQGELRKGGVSLRLPHQPMRVLLLLLRRAGEMVTREEIREEIWGAETYVDFDLGINAAIRQIRFHLSDDAEAPRYIRTIPRRGYVFVAAVERIVPESPPPIPEPQIPAQEPSRFASRRLLALATLAVVVVAIVTYAMTRNGKTGETRSNPIVVTPFRTIGRVDGVDARALTGELRATLSRLPRRHVLVLDESSAARARFRIDGTLQQDRDSLRLIVTLVDIASHTQLWSETYDRSIADRNAMAVDTAHLIANEVARRFCPVPRREPLVWTRVSPKAADLYRRGRVERMRSVPERASNHAEELFEAAVREEPKFAEALSALGDLWLERMFNGPDAQRAEAVRRALEYARRALALQPNNVEALSIFAVHAMQYDYDLATAEERLRRAIDIDPDYFDAHHNLALVLTARAEFDAAIREFQIARELDPIMLDLHLSEPRLYLRSRRYGDALARYRDILAVHPDSSTAMWGMLWCYIGQENWVDGTQHARRIAGLPPLPAGAPATRDDFIAVYRTLEPVILDGYRNGRYDDISLASYYGEIGEVERAFDLLTRAVDLRQPSVCYLLIDPRIDPLRSDPRFQRLIARTKLGNPAQN